jgi:hypothetical protein
MSHYQLPEILRTPLPELCLQMKHMHFNKIRSLLNKAMEPPDPTKVEDAMEILKTIGALDDVEELTSLGEYYHWHIFLNDNVINEHIMKILRNTNTCVSATFLCCRNTLSYTTDRSQSWKNVNFGCYISMSFIRSYNGNCNCISKSICIFN